MGAKGTGSETRKVAVNMDKQIGFKPDAWMRDAIDRHADDLSKLVGKQLTRSAAIRDILTRFFKGSTRDAAYESGFREGFLAAWAEQQKRRFGVFDDNGRTGSDQNGDEPDRAGEGGP